MTENKRFLFGPEWKNTWLLFMNCTFGILFISQRLLENTFAISINLFVFYCYASDITFKCVFNCDLAFKPPYDLILKKISTYTCVSDIFVGSRHRTRLERRRCNKFNRRRPESSSVEGSVRNLKWPEGPYSSFYRQVTF